MTFNKNRFNYGNEIFFGSILALQFVPNNFKLPVLGLLCFSLVMAAFIDCKKNTKRFRRMTRRAASCSCDKAKEAISHLHMPQLLQINCTVCGAETT